jgi:hypothetical protein
MSETTTTNGDSKMEKRYCELDGIKHEVFRLANGDQMHWRLGDSLVAIVADGIKKYSVIKERRQLQNRNGGVRYVKLYKRLPTATSTDFDSCCRKVVEIFKHA